MTIDQDLSFGRFGLRNNDAQHTIIIDPNTGNYVADPAFIIGDAPQRGEYILDALTPNTALGVTIDDGELTLNDTGTGQEMEIIDITHNNPITDNNGDAMLYLGGTLRLNGNGSYYPSGPYSDGVDLTIVFVF